MAAAALALAAGCTSGRHRPPCPPKALCLLYGNGAEPTSLDPAHLDGIWEHTIISQVIVGLTDRDENGRPAPGVATSWDVSPDGLTWTFHLRDAQWSDGVPVTAEDFVFGMRREVDPKTASFSAFQLFPFLKGAQAVNGGRAPLTALGVEAPDPHTVVIRLEHPWPQLPYYASGRAMWPIPRHAVAKWGDAWATPAHYVADGPYNVAAWRLGDVLTLRKNPRYWDPSRACYDEVDFTPTTDGITNERSVRAGDLDVATNPQSNRVTYIRRSGLAAFLRLAPENGVTYLSFNLRDPALKDVRVRQALSMAIDREFITNKLLRGGQRPAYSYVPDRMEGYEPAKVYWSGWSLARRQAEARRLLAAAGYGPARPLKFLVKHRNSNDPVLFLPAVQADWKSIGAEAQLQQNDVQVAYQEYELHDFQVGDAGWLGEDPIVYLDLDRADTGGENYGQYDNPAYDRELDAALNSADPALRAWHMRRAEGILLADAPIAPLYFLSSRNLVNPLVSGWRDNPADLHGAHLLCRLPPRSAVSGAAAA
ncbi:MAG TPA: peptide ABC transporter substrate-binding protein [Caulobacteraceae bacterium]|nr:peptide ABC transporter substrate-binding protein [Caulobacteraceae bacterium]